jgi:hypothetical protein
MSKIASLTCFYPKGGCYIFRTLLTNIQDKVNLLSTKVLILIDTQRESRARKATVFGLPVLSPRPLTTVEDICHQEVVILETRFLRDAPLLLIPPVNLRFEFWLTTSRNAFANDDPISDPNGDPMQLMKEQEPVISVILARIYAFAVSFSVAFLPITFLQFFEERM